MSQQPELTGNEAPEEGEEKKKMCIRDRDYWVALAELALVGVLYAVYCRQVRRRQKEVTHYLEKLEGNVDQATRSGILDCPLPVSYTHLDVYKRQIMYSFRQPIPLNFSSMERP